MIDPSDIPYSKSIDELDVRCPEWRDHLTPILFKAFKAEWLELLPQFTAEMREKVTARQREISANPRYSSHHHWSEWLLNLLDGKEILNE